MKSMNLKRFASTALAGALALSMAVPAFAAGNTTVISGAYEAVTLSVTVPTTGKAIIKPLWPALQAERRLLRQRPADHHRRPPAHPEQE